jgi:Protein of unknown function (DUF2878)
MKVPVNIVNIVLFNISWLAIVLSQSSLVAPMIVGIHLLLHWLVMGKGKDELRLIGGVTLCGVIVDQLLFQAGVFNLAGQPALAPLWLSCLWPVFASTLMHSLVVFQNRIAFAAMCGALGGALSYIAGVRMSAVDFASPLWGPVLLGTLWAVIFPLLMQIAARLQSQRDALQSWSPHGRRAFD